MKAPLEYKVMNIFSMEPAFCAVKLSCSKMNKMGFRLAFWETHPPHSTPTSLIYLGYRTCSHIFSPHTSPLLSLLPLLLPSILVSVCCVWARLHGWRKGKERRGLVWIIHAGNVAHQSSRDPPDACPPDSLLLSLLPLFTCTCFVCGFSIVCVFYAWSCLIIL